MTVLEKRDHLATKIIFGLCIPSGRGHCELCLLNFAQTLVEFLPLFAYTEKSFTAKWSLFSRTITYDVSAVSTTLEIHSSD